MLLFPLAAPGDQFRPVRATLSLPVQAFYLPNSIDHCGFDGSSGAINPSLACPFLTRRANFSFTWRGNLLIRRHWIALVAQLVEHLICNQGVAGSNPAGGTSQVSRSERFLSYRLRLNFTMCAVGDERVAHALKSARRFRFRRRCPQFCLSFAYHGHVPDKFAGEGLGAPGEMCGGLAFYVQNHPQGVPWLAKIAYDPVSLCARRQPRGRISVMRVQVFR